MTVVSALTALAPSPARSLAPPAAGNFSAFLWNVATGTATFIAATPDTNAPSLSLYKLIGFTPAAAAPGAYILQTIYNTQNPAAPPQFYQCADVTVLSPIAMTPEIDAEARKRCAEKHRDM